MDPYATDRLEALSAQVVTTVSGGVSSVTAKADGGHELAKPIGRWCVRQRGMPKTLKAFFFQSHGTVNQLPSLQS